MVQGSGESGFGRLYMCHAALSETVGAQGLIPTKADCANANVSLNLNMRQS